MDTRFLDYYSRELTYMREMAGEFAARHPKIAKRLGMQGIDVADPYVERLIESFSFMAARTHLKLDAEFPRFTQRLLEVVYPNYVAPTPSMAVVRLRPSLAQGDFRRGHPVPRGSVFKSAIPSGEQTACEFRSSQDVTLWPIEITAARLTGVPPDVPEIERDLAPNVALRGALRLTLRTVGDIKFSELDGLDRLPVYIGGDERIASQIFELIHAGGVATVTRTLNDERTPGHVVAHNAVEPEGFGADQGLLPLQWNTFHGHNLLHEYFACPSRFYFFALNGLARGLSRINSNEAEILVLLERMPHDPAVHIDKNRFLLYCTPIINLFTKRIDRIEVKRALTDFHVLPDRSRPLDFEVFSVSRVFGHRPEEAGEVAFTPLFQTLHDDTGNHGRYFSLRREQRVLSGDARKYGTRTAYTGTDVFVSLVDQAEAPYADDIRYLSIEALVTNRDLPRLIPRDGHADLTMPDSVPIDGAVLVRPPSAPRPPYAHGETAWRLIRQLGFNYMPLAELDHATGGQALRNMLRLFVAPGEHEQHAQINSLVGTKTELVVRRLPGDGLLVFGRGIRVSLTVDETGFSGASPFLFGRVIEHYLARHAAINVFTETELESMQRGVIARWPLRAGGRGVL
jgi:type VI secretion system protein ImpG